MPARLVNHWWLSWFGAGVILLLGSLWFLHDSASHLPRRETQASVFRGAAWQGQAIVTEPGTYHIHVVADDAVSVWLDDRRVADQAVNLAPGLHALRVQHARAADDTEFRLTWALPSSREDFVDIPVVPPENAQLTFGQIARALRYPTLVAVSWSAWILCGVTLACVAGLRRLIDADVASSLRSRPMLVLVLFAIVLLAWGVHIGVAPWRSWAADELRPDLVADAAGQWFANGWAALYPPLHFYLLNAVIAPFSVLAQRGWLTLTDGETLARAHVIARCVSIVMGSLTLLLTAVLAAMTIGARRGVVAAVFLLAVPVFVFYSKTTNVDMPYLFWVALAMVLLVKALRSRSPAEYALLGGAVALAVATKDQAYGFFAGAAAVLVWSVMRDTPAGWSWTKRAAATIRDRRLWAGLLTCVAVYVVVMGALWNVEGVREHFRLIVEGPQPFRMFPRSPQGTIDAVLATFAVLVSTLGPVTLVFASAGLAVALANRTQYRELLMLLALPASYVVTFIGIVGYVYDRFLLGFAVIAALFAALGLESTMAVIRNGRVRAVMTAAVLGLALVPSVALNWRIVADSRLQVERWMAANLTDDPFVLAVGTRSYLPNLFPYRHVLVDHASASDLVTRNADVVIINEQWLTRGSVQDEHDTPQALRSAGYREVFMAGGNVRQSAWQRAARFATTMDPIFSNLEKIGPPLRVWRK